MLLLTLSSPCTFHLFNHIILCHLQIWPLLSLKVSLSMILIACNLDFGGREFPGRQLNSMPTVNPFSCVFFVLSSAASLIAAEW